MKKVFLLNIIIALATFSSTYGQDTIAATQNKRLFTLGVTRGLMLTRGQFPTEKSSLCCQTYTQGMYLRRYINQYIALEASISYGSSRQPAATGAVSVSSVTIPITAQYYLFRKKKLRPYIGVGVAYQGQKLTPPLSPEATDRPIGPVKNNSLSVQYNQGIIYQVNTKIEIRESIHIIPKMENPCNTFNITFGIGFNLF